MWIRTSNEQLHNLKDVRLIKLIEVENENGEKVWGIKAFYDLNDNGITLYVSKEKEAMYKVMENFDTVLNSSRVIKIKEEKQEDVSDA